MDGMEDYCIPILIVDSKLKEKSSDCRSRKIFLQKFSYARPQRIIQNLSFIPKLFCSTTILSPPDLLLQVKLLLTSVTECCIDFPNFYALDISAILLFLVLFKRTNYFNPPYSIIPMMLSWIFIISLIFRF